MKLYGIAEIADEIEVNRYTVAQWYRRRKMPEPAATLRMGPVWLERDVRAWIRAHDAHHAISLLNRQWLEETGARTTVAWAEGESPSQHARAIRRKLRSRGFDPLA
jgi:hypothetical protein